MTDKALKMIGLCKKAGMLRSGAFAVEKCIKNGKSEMIIISTDASDNTKKKFENMCKYRDVEYTYFGTNKELGKAMGEERRIVISINDKGFAKAIKEKINLIENGGI